MSSLPITVGEIKAKEVNVEESSPGELIIEFSGVQGRFGPTWTTTGTLTITISKETARGQIQVTADEDSEHQLPSVADLMGSND